MVLIRIKSTKFLAADLILQTMARSVFTPIAKSHVRRFGKGLNLTLAQKE
jgi:hypothetical protein